MLGTTLEVLVADQLLTVPLKTFFFGGEEEELVTITTALEEVVVMEVVWCSLYQTPSRRLRLFQCSQLSQLTDKTDSKVAIRVSSRTNLTVLEVEEVEEPSTFNFHPRQQRETSVPTSWSEL